MSRVIDYSKWNSIEDESEDEQSKSESHSMSSTEKLAGLKLTADKLFAAAECSRSPYDYKIALNQGYRIVLSELERLFKRNGASTEELLRFEISCKMNSSCCHLKLMELGETIDICTTVLLSRASFMTEVQILRLRYFRSFAYYKLGPDNFLKAESDAAFMRNILVSLPEIEPQSAAEYASYFEVLLQEKKKQQIVDDAIRSESEYQKFHDKDSARTKEGWNLYIKKEYRSSAAWFANKLKVMKETFEDIKINESDVLCDLYCGYGKSQSALKNYGEAVKAFLAAASHASTSTAKRSLHLRTASLCCKMGAYEKAIESYATAVILAEDSNEENFNSDFSGIDGQSSFSDGSAAAAYNKLLFIAIANSGLGLCYLKIHEYSRAVDYLKAAIGHMTDDMFNRTVVTPRRKVPFMQSNIVGDSEDTPANKGCEQQILTLATATTRAYHLLSALEYLSDAYAAMREWEKAMYTANCSIEVCQCFLAIIRPCSTPHTIGLNEEGTPTGAIEQDVKMKSSSIEIKEHVALALRVRSTVSIDECGADDLHAERESHVKAIRRKCAAASLAKGHMMKKILYHDINRTDGSGEVAEGYTFAGLDKNLSSEPLYRPSHDSSTTHNVGVSAVEVIAALWNESAAEFNRLGDIDEAYSVYKDVAALWGTLAAFEPYSDSFFLIESSSLMSVKDGTDEPSVASSNSLTTERDDVCTSCTSSIAESVVRNALPVQPTSTENIRRIEAAVKAKDAWITAADVARQLCKHVPGGGVSGAKEDEEESLKNMDSADIRRFDLEMSSWRQVIQCQYYAGLCAMLHGMAGAEVLFEEAQETKGTYQDIAGALSEAEKREELRDVAGPVSNGKSPDGAHESDSGSSHVIPDNLKSDRKEFTKKSWLSYNTLCCDISYHLAYTYLREKKVAYAIAEAEMAIGFALRSTDSKMRRRKCWGLLALGFHASGQTPETDRALTEARQLRLGNSVDDAGMGDDEYLKLLHLFMEHNSSSRKAKKSLTDAVKLTDDKEEVELIHPVQAAPGDSSLFLSLLNMKHFDRRSLFFLFLGASSFLVLFFSICVAFMM